MRKLLVSGGMDASVQNEKQNSLQSTGTTLTHSFADPAFLPEKVKRHAALVLGNVCQTDDHRATAGQEGAVEGLFALCDTDDGMVRANALWALGNLARDPLNQVMRQYSIGLTRRNNI